MNLRTTETHTALTVVTRRLDEEGGGGLTKEVKVAATKLPVSLDGENGKKG